MSSGNILWGSQNPIVFKNSFGVSNTDTGGRMTYPSKIRLPKGVWCFAYSPYGYSGYRK